MSAIQQLSVAIAFSLIIFSITILADLDGLIENWNLLHRYYIEDNKYGLIIDLGETYFQFDSFRQNFENIAKQCFVLSVATFSILIAIKKYLNIMSFG